VRDYLFVSKLGSLPLTLIYAYLARAGCEAIFPVSVEVSAGQKERCFPLRVSVSSC